MVGFQRGQAARAVSTIIRNRLRADRESMKMKAFEKYRPDWDWKGMAGSAACIKWCFRDLENLDAALQLFSGRNVAVQAGGNIGIFAKRLAEEFEAVHTFEPDDLLFEQMRLNVPEKNVAMYKAALGDRRDGVQMRCTRRDNSGRAVHEGLTHVAGPGNTPQMLIDDLGLRACNLIYLDIEGYELRALHGAAETIAAYRPVIAVEINGASAHYGSSRDQIRDFFARHNYVMRLAQHSDEVYVPWGLGK